MITEINSPIFLIKLIGNVKEKASKIEFTAIASYEQMLNKTIVAVKVDPKNRKEMKRMKILLREFYGTIGAVHDITFYANGIEVICQNPELN